LPPPTNLNNFNGPEVGNLTPLQPKILKGGCRYRQVSTKRHYQLPQSATHEEPIIISSD